MTLPFTATPPANSVEVVEQTEGAGTYSEGDTVVLECAVIGGPTPAAILWMANDEIIEGIRSPVLKGIAAIDFSGIAYTCSVGGVASSNEVLITVEVNAECEYS